MIIISYRRKASIYQTQLADFIGIKCIEIYDMNVPKDYRAARKKFRWIPIHLNRGKQANQTKKIMSISQRLIFYFKSWVPKLKDKYLYRFPRVEIPRFEDFGLRVVSKKEWDMHRYLKSFIGYFENLFEFNDFHYFDDLQEKLEKEGVSFKIMFLKDIIAYELLRLNLGFKNYTGIERMGRFAGESPLYSITYDPKLFPKATDLSFVLTKIPANEFFNYFQLLVKECVDYGIIVPRILIWDGQFIRSNCKNNKEKEGTIYNDIEAGHYRYIGIKKGVGYDPGILYAHCFDHWFPVYFKMFP